MQTHGEQRAKSQISNDFKTCNDIQNRISWQIKGFVFD